MYQTKVSKLVVNIGGGGKGDDGGERRPGCSGPNSPARNRADSGRRPELVRVSSWSDRRNGDGAPCDGSVAAESRADGANVMPSVKELAKQFSSYQVSATLMLFASPESRLQVADHDKLRHHSNSGRPGGDPSKLAESRGYQENGRGSEGGGMGKGIEPTK